MILLYVNNVIIKSRVVALNNGSQGRYQVFFKKKIHLFLTK